MRHYQSFDHASIDVRFSHRDPRCSKEQIFLATRGSNTEPGAMILDHAGKLLWRQPKLAAEVHDFRVQEYRGENFLTFWAGKADHGGKEGSWYMVRRFWQAGILSTAANGINQMDDTYTIRREISAPGFTFGDMHEFQLTDEGTALVTVYNPIPMDLSPIGGPQNGYALDGVFQEIDIETKQVLFQWNASSHIPASASERSFTGCSNRPENAFAGCGNTKDAAFDYYHINSVQKDPSGNYLVSGRHTSSLTYIDGGSGQVLWHMGGPLNEFTYLPEGTGRLFTWQHHARLHNGSTITLLDNNAISNEESRTESRALRLEVDVAQKTVSAQQSFRHPKQLMSFSQGNAQVLEDSGNLQVGWGNCAAFTEFSPDGEVLCDARFAPAAFFPLQPLSSYRAYRGTWIGRPKDAPKAVAAKGRIYVSWNGATEVARWRVEASLDGDQFSTALEVPRLDFETQFTESFGRYKSVRIAALNKDGHLLGTSSRITPPRGFGGLSGPEASLLAVAVVAAVSCVCIYIAYCWLRGRKNRSHMEKGYKPVKSMD